MVEILGRRQKSVKGGTVAILDASLKIIMAESRPSIKWGRPWAMEFGIPRWW
jgi:hypothetical protein